MTDSTGGCTFTALSLHTCPVMTINLRFFYTARGQRVRQRVDRAAIGG
jgi:hypothetical protein